VKYPPVWDVLSDSSKRYYEKAYRVRFWSRITGVLCILAFASAIFLLVRSAELHLWLLLALNVGTAFMAQWGYRLSHRSVWRCQEVIEICLNVSLLCRLNMPEDFDISSVHNGVLCNCTHPDIVCHAAENNMVPFGDGLRVKLRGSK
jgi:hypothetical protein